MLNTALVFAAEATGSESAGGPNPYLVGGISLAILLFFLVAVVAFGGGREHS